ncbi:hypothetical protein IHE33_11660 [Mycetohabitans endofungorum]|uniref:hypothetical protein n=1 Tax=Mycetohabitans endofungorum TaxID=417203 RepID=UPI0030CCEA85
MTAAADNVVRETLTCDVRVRWWQMTVAYGRQRLDRYVHQCCVDGVRAADRAPHHSVGDCVAMLERHRDAFKYAARSISADVSMSAGSVP